MLTQQASNWATLASRWAEISHNPGNSVTVGVVRWPAAGDTAGSSLRRLSFLEHRIYNLLDTTTPLCDNARVAISRR